MIESEKLNQTIRGWMEPFFNRSMYAWRRYVKSTGLTMPQFIILMHLAHGRTGVVHEIGENMQISSAAASQLIERLAQAGLVERTEDPIDRRARHIVLSAKGRELIERGIDERYRWVEDLVAGLSDLAREAVRIAFPALVEAERLIPQAAPRVQPCNKSTAETTFKEEE